MRLGDPVYWLEFDRPPADSARVYMKDGRFFRCDGDRLLVLLEDGKLKVIASAVFFDRKEEAECSAIGWAVRLVQKFKYKSATAYGADGATLFSAGA